MNGKLEEIIFVPIVSCEGGFEAPFGAGDGLDRSVMAFQTKSNAEKMIENARKSNPNLKHANFEVVSFKRIIDA